MRSSSFVLSAMTILALSGAFALSSAPATAQQAGDQERKVPNITLEEITVVAPRVIRSKLRDSRGVATYDLLTLTHQVSYGDLNLAHPGDAKTLKDRIAKTADEVCQQLANVSPVEPKSQECVHQAVQSATPGADAAIAAAGQ